MAISGEAPTAIAVMWAMTTVSLIMVLLRLYVRTFMVRCVGPDDHIFWIAWVFLLNFTIFITVSAAYGFGQNIFDLEVEDIAPAIKFELVGQTFGVLGMAVAKISLGVFLIRIVVEAWHKICIWAAIVSLVVVSILTAIMLWVQCTPTEFIWDKSLSGSCDINVTPFGVLLGVWCAAVDFFFAGFPWVFIWGLNMRTKEKWVLALSMSLGVLAGVCGIVRSTELLGLASSNYTKDTVPLIVWSAAEIAVTMICIGLPMLRPLYKRIFNGATSNNAGGEYHNSGSGRPYRLRSRDIHESRHSGKTLEDDYSAECDLVDMKGSSTARTYATRDDRSDEEILGPEFRKGQITVHTDVCIEREQL